ncbi:major facilitator superfamily domain-containing protein [Emericellopsis atlantica]|uniref:Major facilitator superfamily domain-containing protein n=1 Tax=Emericellopsis atlantica TaxID=2614577 RepID=A0A9P7ZDL0_9HYPO|nr:major facilitator superfamily domain-containing protein [Emericellopsis atlantica]KAG9250060.1 major facilitator superfamily domain-containing protein [Emericellopsis atlantica]
MVKWLKRSLDIAVQPVSDVNGKAPNSNDLHTDQTGKEKVETCPGHLETDKAVAPMTVEDEPPAPQYATPRELALLSTVFTMATFMIAIDGSILATAIPKITSDFGRLDDVPWYGSAYLLTEMAFQPTFGRLYSLFDARILYLSSIFVFEAGSIVCAAAPISAALITGRVVAGIGAAGLLCGSLAVYGRSVPLRARPFGMALVTSMYGVAGVLGPTLGGLITDEPKLTWRFCFWYVQYPLGAVTFAIAWKVLKNKTPVHERLSLREKLKKLDLLGGFLLIAGLVTLFFALQWGGSKYSWSNPRVYVCIIVFVVLISAFAALQAKKKEEATIPTRILSQRTVAISCVFNMLMSMAHNTHMYYLAFYFQAALGTNAVTSGVRCLAYGIPCSVAIIVTGACISSRGHYVPFMWLGTSVFIAGCVLLRELDVDSSMGEWIGFQILSGAGIGLAEQVPFIAVQVVLPDNDMPTACALVVFFRLLGGAVGLSIASNLFSSELFQRLADAVDGVTVEAIQDAGASDLAKSVPAAMLPLVRKAFSYAVTEAFILPIAVACASLILSFGMQRRWIPDDRIQPSQESEMGAAPESTGSNDVEWKSVRNEKTG